jgi:hypothetical protein
MPTQCAEAGSALPASYDSGMARNRGAWAFGLTAAACCWSAVVLGGALWLPGYQGVTATSGGTITHTSTTLAAANGLAAAAWLAVGLLAVLTIFGAASIGVFVLPATLLLGAAARLTPAG